jgi:tetratricopeptide (TPR) repeat protein
MRRTVLLLILGCAATSLAAGADRDDGIRFFQAQRYPEARTSLEAAVRQNPRDARAAASLGRVLYEENELDRATYWLEKSTGLDPTSSSNMYWLGRAYGQQAIYGNVFLRAKLAGKIRRAFARAVELDPDNMDARIGLLEFYLRAPGFMGGSLANARTEADAIRARDPLHGHRARARIEEHAKHLPLAAAEYEAAIREFPSRTEPFYWIESGAIDKHDWAAAFAAMDRLAALRPDDAGPRYEIGRLAALSGHELDRGEANLRLYLQHEPRGTEPSIAMAHARLAEILERKGDGGRAREEFTAAIRLDPGLPDAKTGLARIR